MEKRWRRRNIGRFSGNHFQIKIQFPFTSSRAKSTRRCNVKYDFTGGKGEFGEWPFQFYESFTYFSTLLRRHVTHDRRTSSHGLWNSVSDRQPKATRPFCTEHRVSKWFKYIIKKRKRERERKKNEILIHLTSSCPYTFALFQILTLTSCSRTNWKIHFFLPKSRHKYLV